MILGTTAGSTTFYGNDFALKYVASTQDYVGFGLRMVGTDDATLSEVSIPKSVIDANDNSATWPPYRRTPSPTP